MKSPEVTLIVCSIAAILLTAVLAAIVIRSFRGRGAEPFPSPYTGRFGWARALGYALIPVLLCVAFSGLALLGFVGIVGWVVLIFLLIEGSRKYWATQQHGLLWLLTISAERDMPLIPAVEAFARERGGSFSLRASQLAGMLKAGMPLPDALDRCPGLLPRYAAPTIRVGYETGTLAQALRRAATVYDRDEPMWIALQGEIAYLLLLPAFGSLLLMFVMLKIVPSFEKIFKDFDARLPNTTIAVIELSAFFGRYWLVLAPGLAAGDIAIMLALNRTGRTRLMTAWGILVWLAAMLLMGLIMTAMMVPLNDLIMDLSGKK